MPTFYEYFFNFHAHYEHQSSEGDSGEQYDYSWSSSTNFTFYNVTIEPSKDDIVHESVNSTHKFLPGDRAYLVFAAWGEGDSFGNGDNTDHAAIHLFKNLDLARLLFLKIAQDYYIQDKDLGIYSRKNDFITDSGIKLNIDTSPWSGYFEHLDTLKIFEVDINRDHCRAIECFLEQRQTSEQRSQEIDILSHKVLIENSVDKISKLSKAIKI